VNTRQHKLYRCLLATIVVALNVLPVSAADVVIQEVVELKGSVVRLGDVAKVKAGDKQEADRLAAIPLMPAPAPGRRRFVRMREVQDLVAAHDENMGALNFRGELVVEIVASAAAPVAGSIATDRRAVWAGTSAACSANMNDVQQAALAKLSAGPRLTDGQMAEANNYIKRAIVGHLSRQSGRDADWRVTFEMSESNLAKVLEAKTALQCSGGVLPWTGLQRMVVAFATARGPVRLRLEVEVGVENSVIVAAQPIERGQVITAADLAVEQWTTLPVESPRHQLAASLDSLIGMEATKPIQEGDAIYGDDFRSQLLVKKGEEIVVYARGGGIQVRTIARARQDGARGELIGVESLDEKEPFQAVVTATREAVVFTGAKVASDEKVVEQPFRKLRHK
jgi:flagella basal body P-ring formation protein FlgA